MTKDELIDLFNEFVNQIGEWNTLVRFAKEKGFTESQIDDVIENISL